MGDDPDLPVWIVVGVSVDGLGGHAFASWAQRAGIVLQPYSSTVLNNDPAHRDGIFAEFHFSSSCRAIVTPQVFQGPLAAGSQVCAPSQKWSPSCASA